MSRLIRRYIGTLSNLESEVKLVINKALLSDSKYPSPSAQKMLTLPPMPPRMRACCQRHNSALAQLVEQMTVNHWVAGSSPAGGAKLKRVAEMQPFFCGAAIHSAASNQVAMTLA